MTTGNNNLEERLSQEDGVSKEMTTGIHEDGFQDPTGEYPRRHNWFGSSQSAAGRGVKINDLWMSGSVLGANFDIPVATASIFPFNNINETPSGHSFEMDDTPGNERILIKHHSGAGVELKQDGSVIVASRSHQIQVVGSDHEVVVQGKGNITYDGDLTLTVNGDYNLNVNGNYNVKVGANENHSVKDTYIIETGDTHSTVARGNLDLKVGGHTAHFYAGDKKEVFKKDVRYVANKDFIVNARRNVRLTAMDMISGSAGKNMTWSGKKMWISGEMGQIGGEDFHYFGSLYTGPKGDYGHDVVFQGNLLGRALEAWTSKYSKYTEEAHSAHISNFAGISKYSDFAANAGNALFALGSTVSGMIGVVVPPAPTAPLYQNWQTGHVADGSDEMVGPTHPDYQFDWSGKSTDVGDPLTEWYLTHKTPYHIQKERHEKLSDKNGADKIISPDYVTNKDWWEVWNKVSPWAVRYVRVDEDDSIYNKIVKADQYSYYFVSTPDTDDVRSKLRTMHPGPGSDIPPYIETGKCIDNLEKENRMSEKWDQAGPSSPYQVKRKGNTEPKAKFGYTLLGNPVERASKSFSPKNKNATSRTILADPNYNPDKRDKPITSGTKLSKSSTMGKFMGAPGSKASLDYVPIIKDRQDLARQYYLHAWLMEGVAAAAEFKNYRLQVTEGYYHPAAGINELSLVGGGEGRYWKEPYDSGGQKAMSSGKYINELRHTGECVIYTLFNSRGKVDYSATFDLSLYIRDTFFFDQLSLDYDYARPDGVLSQQLLVIMPKIDKSFKASFKMQTSTYFNRQTFDGNDLVEITD